MANDKPPTVSTKPHKGGLPAFLLKRTKAKRLKPIVSIRCDGDTGTPEMKRRMGAVIESRETTSTGHVITVGARVPVQYPHDRYRQRQELDPRDLDRNERMWEAAERLRNDFYLSRLQAKLCSSFSPRVSGGEAWSHDDQVAAFERYKAAMGKVGQSVRNCLFMVCIEGWSATDWATKSGKRATEGITLLRAALEDLGCHYGYFKN